MKLQPLEVDMFDTHFNEKESMTIQIIRFCRLYASGVFGHLERQSDPILCMVSFYVKGGHLQLEFYPDNLELRSALEPELAMIESCLPNKFKDTKDLSSNSINLRSLTMALMDNHAILKPFDINVSDFCYFDNHVSSVITLFEKSHRESHYQLSPMNTTLPRSFYDAVYQEYRSELSRFLNQISRGYLNVNLDFNDTIRKAARALLKHLGYKGLWDTSYNKIRKIAQSKYNNQYPRGTMCFIINNSIGSDTEADTTSSGLCSMFQHPNLNCIVAFKSPVPLANHRHVRKLLSTATAETMLVCDAEHVIGIANPVGEYDLTREDLFTITFVGMNAWDFGNGHQKMLRIHGDRISLPDPVMDYAHFKHLWMKAFNMTQHKSDNDQMALEDFIPKETESDRGKTDTIRGFYRMTTAFCRDRTETILIVASHASQEAHRLGQQGFVIQPLRMGTATAKTLSRLGDAMIFSPDGICHAAGVTLDGLASEKMEQNKGFRFNTAVRYVTTQRIFCPECRILAIMTNEDGTMDVFEG